MSLAIKYERVEDARMRLRGTVVLYKGEPVKIIEVKEGEGKDDIVRVLFKPLPLGADEAPKKMGKIDRAFDLAMGEAKAEQRKYISSKHFDIAPFRMGYVNSKAGAFYCSRVPGRLQKQGLCGENFAAKNNYGKALGFDSFLFAKETPAMVRGDYPSFAKTVKLLDQSPSVAFHRDFSLVKDTVLADLIYLYHKAEKVGMYLVADNTVRLGDKFKCLRESLQECGLKIA
jgi:hypothetical protein